MTSSIARLHFPYRFRSFVGLLLIGSSIAVSGCSDDEPTTDAATPPSVTLNSESLPVPLSTMEADRFFAVTATTGNQYYASGFTTVGDDSQMAVARFESTGGPDASFGSNGVATVNIAVGTGKKAEFARSIVVQSDGKVVIAGPIEHDTAATGDAARDTDIAIVRFDATGQLDQAFGINGITRLNLSTGIALPNPTPNSPQSFRGDTAWGLTLLPEDKLLVIGGKHADGANRTDIDYAVIKLTANGKLDKTFGTDGLVTLDVERGNDSPRTAIVQPDGKIVVTGHTEIAEDTPNEVVSSVLFRLTSDGQFDSTFGNNGVVSNALGLRIAEAYDVALQGTSLVIAGYGRPATATTVDILSARFLADGTWDKTYGESGVTLIDVAGQDDRSRTLKLLPNQHVLIVGQGKPTATTQDGAVVLLTANGQRETKLNGNGVALIDLGGQTDALFGVALSPDFTKAVAVGWKGVLTTESSPTNNDDTQVVRFAIPSPS
jgi:uncharacterized delta-60 repeat protein